MCVNKYERLKLVAEQVLPWQAAMTWFLRLCLRPCPLTSASSRSTSNLSNLCGKRLETVRLRMLKESQNRSKPKQYNTVVSPILTICPNLSMAIPFQPRCHWRCSLLDLGTRVRSQENSITVHHTQHHTTARTANSVFWRNTPSAPTVLRMTASNMLVDCMQTSQVWLFNSKLHDWIPATVLFEAEPEDSGNWIRNQRTHKGSQRTH